MKLRCLNFATAKNHYVSLRMLVAHDLGLQCFKMISLLFDLTNANKAQIPSDRENATFSALPFDIIWCHGAEIVQTDHQPLFTIMKKSLRDLSHRLQKKLLKLMKYNFNCCRYSRKETSGISRCQQRLYGKRSSSNRYCNNKP